MIAAAVKLWSSVALLVVLSVMLIAGQARTPSQQFQEAVSLMDTRGDYPAAIRLFEAIARGSDRRLAARALLYIGLCYEQLGREDAAKAYQRLVRDFADQSDLVTQAQARLAALARPVDSSGSTLAARRIWAGSGVGPWSALSPDGQHVTFPDWETGDLALLDLSTGQKRPLTRNASWFSSEGFANSRSTRRTENRSPTCGLPTTARTSCASSS